MAFAPGFVAELDAGGYASPTIKSRLGLFVHVSGWLQRHGLSAADLTPERVGQFIESRRRDGYKTLISLHSMGLVLGYLRSIGVVSPASLSEPGPHGSVLDGYRRYLINERALTDHTIGLYMAIARLFLSALAEPVELGRLRTAQVAAFVSAECPRRSVPAAQYLAVGLRSFLRYLHVVGITPASLVASVPAVCRRQPHLARGLDADTVRALLAGCDRARLGLRDRAILTLMVRLGLRAGEVARLRLDDIDWHRGEVVVRGKGDRQERLPLPVDVGEALVAYLRTERPLSQDRCVFLVACAPYGGMRSSAICTMVRRTCRRSGLAEVGAHRLRHSAATGMLQAGASLAEIAEVLRHRSLQTTATYAKVDRRLLASLAMPWPQARP
jgi:integrase/recombinase XerD